MAEVIALLALEAAKPIAKKQNVCVWRSIRILQILHILSLNVKVLAALKSYFFFFLFLPEDWVAVQLPPLLLTQDPKVFRSMWKCIKDGKT